MSVNMYENFLRMYDADDEEPILSCTNVIYSTTDGVTSTDIEVNPPASDNVDSSLTAVCSHSSSSRFAAGDTNVSCNATDKAGNTAFCTFIVTIIGKT